MPAGEPSYLLRPATGAEREHAARSWRTLAKLPTDGPRVEGHLHVALGRFSVARDWLQSAVAEAIELALDRAEVWVADHPDAPGLALGWVAYQVDPALLLAVHVQADARGAWVGRTLLQHALRAVGTPTCVVMTPAGQRLLDHIKTEKAAA